MRARTVPCHVTAFLVDESKTSGDIFQHRTKLLRRADDTGKEPQYVTA